MQQLTYVTDNDPGYHRKGRGKGFEYFDEKGKKITDEAVLQRIEDLVIPPNWKNVWVCKNPLGHLQATGKDVKGRKQYLYHEEWTRLQNENKFRKLVEFARSLPAIRSRIEQDLRKHGWPREKVLALVVRILDESYLRIGNEFYKKNNKTYGLTTLRRKHMEINGSKVKFEFKSKSGKYRKVSLKGRKLTRLIKGCSELPGYEIFKYIDDNGDKHPVDSQDVNEYLREIAGDDFTAKDFRTWGGTVLAVELIEAAQKEIEKHPRRKLTTCLVRNVANELGNTVAICRDYYIHPAIMHRIENNSFDPEQMKNRALKKYPKLKKALDEEEILALSLVEEHVKDKKKKQKIQLPEDILKDL